MATARRTPSRAARSRGGATRSGSSNRGSPRRPASTHGVNRRTADHEDIRRWAEARGGQPARVKGTESPRGIGILRIDFPGGRGREALEPISWEEFFQTMDDHGLELIYQETTATGRPSRFSKLVRQARR